MNKSGSYYIKAFDGLRGIFVPPVLMTHLGWFDFLHNGPPWLHRIWMIVSGHTALYGFFCLSGFLITTILLHEYARNGSISIKKFLIRRALRLFPPLVFFYATILLLMFSGTLSANYVAWLCSVFYCYNFIPNKFWCNELSHTWSLSVEEQFYFVWPWLMKYCSRYKIFFITLLVALLSVACYMLYPLVHINYRGETHTLVSAFKTERWLIPAIFPVLAGSYTALLYFERKSWVQYIMQQWWVLPMMCIMICCPLLLPLPMLHYSMLFQSIGLCFIIVYVATHRTGPIEQLLTISPLVLIGKMSYAIYIWQGLFLGTGPTYTHWWKIFPQNIILTFAVASCSYFFIEKRMMGYKAKYV